MLYGFFTCEGDGFAVAFEEEEDIAMGGVVGGVVRRLERPSGIGGYREAIGYAVTVLFSIIAASFLYQQFKLVLAVDYSVIESGAEIGIV